MYDSQDNSHKTAVEQIQNTTIRDTNSCIKTSDINSAYKIWHTDSAVLSLYGVKPIKDKTMKTILYILFAATMMVGCNNSKATKVLEPQPKDRNTLRE